MALSPTRGWPYIAKLFVIGNESCEESCDEHNSNKQPHDQYPPQLAFELAFELPQVAFELAFELPQLALEHVTRVTIRYLVHGGECSETALRSVAPSNRSTLVTVW